MKQNKTDLPVYKSGFVAVIGRPNAGKSTLVNKIVGQKVAIVSEKAQTTRNTIKGIYTDENMQAVFLDTPGIHKPKYKLDKYMVDAARTSMDGVDVIFYLFAADTKFGKGEEYIIENLKQKSIPVYLIVNKIDLLDKEALLPLIAELSQKMNFKEIIPLSALSGENINHLLEVLKKELPEGPQYYPEDMISDLPEQILTAELIREQVLLKTREEVPHSVAVTVSQMEERPNGKLYVYANIYVDRDSQKGIIIGRNGEMLKNIGTGARKEIEKIFACPVYLELRVKTKKDWRDNDMLLKDWSLTPEN